MQKKFHQKAFTLIEMLIVIVIIWVLSAALIPRLTSVRDRANDVARKADLNQISTAIIARQMDHNWTLPGEDTGYVQNAEAISAELKAAWLDSVPQDPKVDAVVVWLWSWQTATGQYGYMKITKNWIPNSAFVVMAKMETPGASNRLYNWASGSWAIARTDETTDFTPCKTMTRTWANWFSLNPGGECFFDDYGQLRYLIIR